ncbi:phosphate--nucleotide phosphotransferase, partial [Amycolatopsis regifaucium]
MAKKDRVSVRDALRIGKGTERHHPGSFPIGPRKKPKALKDLVDSGDRLAKLQEALYAE